MNEPLQLVMPNEHQLERTWARLACRRYQANTSPQNSPMAVILAGQPGAGKSVLANGFRETFRDHGGAVFIDPGELLELHPAYVVMGRGNDRQIVSNLRPAAARLAARLLERAVDRRRHVLLECSFDAPESAQGLLQYLKEEGYYVVFVVLMVSPETSREAVRARYEKLREKVAVARWIDADFHDCLADVIPAVLEATQRSGLADELHVISRDGVRLSGRQTSRQLAPRGNAEAENDTLTGLSKYPAGEQAAIRRRMELQQVLRRFAATERV